jgi:hypothetical protein
MSQVTWMLQRGFCPVRNRRKATQLRDHLRSYLSASGFCPDWGTITWMGGIGGYEVEVRGWRL